MSQVSGKFILNATVALAKLSQSSAVAQDLVYWSGSAWVAGHPSLINQTYTSTTTLSNVEQDMVVLNSASAINLNINFLASTRKKPLIVKNIGSGVVTIFPISGNLIDAGPSTTLQNKDAIVMVPDGTDWWLIKSNSSSSSSYQIDGGSASSNYGGTATVDGGGA